MPRLCGRTPSPSTLLSEPHTIYRLGIRPTKSKFALCGRGSETKFWQQLHCIEDLSSILGDLSLRADFSRQDIWISQATFGASAHSRTRRCVENLSHCWVDIDIRHPPQSFDKHLLPPGARTLADELLAQQLAIEIQDAGLPLPTYIVATGGGLCPKWIFSEDLDHTKLYLWERAESAIVSAIAKLQTSCDGKTWRWPVDRTVKDPSRILRLPGTMNPRWGRACEIVWRCEKQYGLDEFLEYLDIFETANSARERCAASSQSQDSSHKTPHRNVSTACATEESHIQQSALAVWQCRLEFIYAILRHRATIKEGNRNNIYWLVANALAWVYGDLRQVESRLVRCYEDHFMRSGWSRIDAINSASSVLMRLKRQEQPYKIKTPKLLEKLSVTDEEKVLFQSKLRSRVDDRERNAGAMGYPKIAGVSLEEFKKITKERQSASAIRTSTIRSERSRDRTRTALEMLSKGMTKRKVAELIGVSHTTISRWHKLLAPGSPAGSVRE